MRLADERCEPPKEGDRPLSAEEAAELARETPRWSVREREIEREFGLKDFREAVDFVNRVAEIAEEQGHHPEIAISYRTVRLRLTTHAIGGLSRNDFIAAAKIDEAAGDGRG